MNNVPGVFEIIQYISAVVTPFIVLWVGIAASARRSLIRDVKSDIKSLREENTEAQKECRDNIRSLSDKMSEYPRRSEITDTLRDFRLALQIPNRTYNPTERNDKWPR